MMINREMIGYIIDPFVGTNLKQKLIKDTMLH